MNEITVEQAHQLFKQDFRAEASYSPCDTGECPFCEDERSSASEQAWRILAEWGHQEGYISQEALERVQEALYGKTKE